MSFGNYYGGNEVRAIRSKEQEIPRNLWDPHYTDERFTRGLGGRTIYLAAGLTTVSQHGTDHVEGAHYNYSDRLSGWYGYDKVREAEERAREIVGQQVFSALYFETMLKHVYDDPTTELLHIVAGVNVSSGYSYRVYGTVSENEQ